VCRQLEDAQGGVRDAAVAALQQAARVLGSEPLRRALEASASRLSHVTAVLEGAGSAHAPQPAPPTQPAPAPPLARALKPTRAAGGTLRTAPAATDAAAQAADAPRALAAAVADDGLVHAQPRRVSSEKELLAECDAVAALLGASVEWDVRMAAMARLEGLLLGGAADSFQQALVAALQRPLRDPLLAQLADRRSSVVKQATHLVVVLAQRLGAAFEPTAEALLPQLFGVVIISIKVMSDAGVACGRDLLRHCHGPRLALRIAEAAKSDRNAKLRCAAFDWLTLALGEWEDWALERAVGGVEEALKGGMTDADADARSNARRAACAYAARAPDAFLRLCARAEAAASKRLRACVAEGGGGWAEAKPAQPPRRASTAAAFAAVRAAARQSRGDEAVSVVVHAPPRSPGGGPGSWAQASRVRPGTAGAAAALPNRHTVSDIAAYALPEQAGPPTLQAAPTARRALSASAAQLALSLSPARAHEAPPAPVPRRSSLGSPGSGGLQRGATHPPATAAAAAWPPSFAQPGAPPPPCSVSAAVGALSRAQSGGAACWAARCDAYAQLAVALSAGGDAQRREAEGCSERLCCLLAEGCEDGAAPVRGCEGALGALRALALHAPASARPHLERLLPGCFARLVDAREALRAAASEALAALGDALPPEALLPPLLRALEAARTPRQRTGVLEFALHALLGGGGAASGAPGPGPGPGLGAGPPPSPAPALQHALRCWLSKLAPLAQEQHAGLRNAAVANLVAVYERVDPHSLLHLLQAQLAPAAAQQLRRTLAPYLPELEAALAARAALGAGSPGGGAGGSPLRPRVARASAAEAEAEAAATPLPRLSAERRAASLPAPGPRRSSPYPAAAPAPPSPAGDDEEALLRLLSGLGLGDAAPVPPSPSAAHARRLRALHDLRRLAASAPRALLGAYCPQLLLALLEALGPQAGPPGGAAQQGGQQLLREAAALALKDLAHKQPELMGEHLGLVAPRVLHAARAGHPAGAAADAEGVLDALFSSLEPRRCLEALRTLLPAQEAQGGAARIDATAVLPIRCLSLAVQRAPAELLRAMLPAMLPQLIAAFGCEHADVRKTVVFALVDLYLGLGEELRASLQPLTSAQAKLLDIYIARSTSSKASAAH